MDASAASKANEILAALPDDVYQRLLPDLEARTLQVGETLFHPAERLLFAYFPTSSVVTLSYAVNEAGEMASAWPVGREGIVGISLFLDSPNLDNRAGVEIGGLAFRLPASALLAEFRREGELQRLLLRYVSALVTQASQLSVCNHYHPIEQRLSRFLVRAFDCVSGGEVEITYERIAALLGARLETITGAAGYLQAARVIEYAQGRVRLISREKLEKRGCACAGIIRRAFQAVSEKGAPAA
jgi:CRP-like cAMP-binding protein